MGTLEEEKIKKLKYMRRLATGLLLFMAVVFIIFKRYEEKNFIISCIVAFSEASMVGALADWFAVVALFRHPLGLKLIPHTAIIQQNQDRIGESLGSFVVKNFFTEEILRGKLSRVRLTNNITSYIKENKKGISIQIAENLPDFINYIFSNEKLTGKVVEGAAGFLKKTEISPYIDKLITYSINSKMHIPLVKQLVNGIYIYVENNKDETMKLVEGINKALALPFIGDLTYKSILKTLANVIIDLENEKQTPLVMELLYNLPEKLSEKFRDSVEVHGKIEDKKIEYLDSEGFIAFIQERLDTAGGEVLAYSLENKDELTVKISDLLEKLISEFEENEIVNRKVEIWIQNTIVQIAKDYSEEIGSLISDTVKNWPMEDMVEKLEIQVGGDLQYIRINGTVIGGLAGLAIHLLSSLF